LEAKQHALLKSHGFNINRVRHDDRDN